MALSELYEDRVKGVVTWYALPQRPLTVKSDQYLLFHKFQAPWSDPIRLRLRAGGISR
jgi:hypothetical protein